MINDYDSQINQHQNLTAPVPKYVGKRSIYQKGYKKNSGLHFKLIPIKTFRRSVYQYLSVALWASDGAVILLVALNLPRLDGGAVEEPRLGSAPTGVHVIRLICRERQLR